MLDHSDDFPWALGMGIEFEVTGMNIQSSLFCKTLLPREALPKVIQYLLEMSLSLLQSCSLLFADSKQEGDHQHCVLPFPSTSTATGRKV